MKMAEEIDFIKRWVDLPKWLRWGIAFAVIDLIIVIIMGLAILKDKDFVASILFVWSQLPGDLILSLMGYEVVDNVTSFFLLSFLGITSWFLLGSLIGYIKSKTYKQLDKNVLKKEENKIILNNGLIIKKIKKKNTKK